MLKLMIVDDENLFREALIKTIPWNDLGFEVCCEAENGFDALEKIAEFKPDIALVDINMPMMDGIELAAEIKESGLDVRVIIITGYNEFSYARQAIEVGVENYLLKPIDEDQLIKVLNSVKKKIDIKIDELKKQVIVYKPLLKEMLLNSLLQGTRLFAEKELITLKKSLTIEFDTQHYQVIVMELCEKQEYKWDENERQLWIFAVLNIANEILSDNCVFESCQDIHGRLCIVVHVKPLDMYWQQDVSNLCERIRISVTKFLKFGVTIGVSDVYTGYRYITKAYNEALYALKNRLMIGENRVILYENVMVSDELSINIYPVEQRQQLLMAARMSAIDEVDETIHSIFDEIRLSKTSNDLVIVKCIELVSTCFEFVAGTGNKIQSVFGVGFNLLEEIHKKKTINELELWIKEIFHIVMNSEFANMNIHFSKTVEDAKKYINENFSKFDLKIDEIARQVYIGYARLCFLFKRETGKTINDYITETRINRSKKLIDEGCHSVSAVSARIGYADANYFGKCFKKIYGITPGRYIDNILSR
jgi:two-component system, response regulator YesN